MINLFTEHQKSYSDRVETALNQYLGQLSSSQLTLAMQYSLLAGGKRVRPFLVYATGEMFGVTPDKLDAPACAIEAIHTYSLIHDDLPAMDNDNLRRGKPTCHIQFGEATAILAGDSLQTLAFSILAGEQALPIESRMKMIQELAQASGASGMCLGQTMDLAAEHQHINLEQLKQIHHYKTGVLIQAAVRLGLYSAGASAHQYQPILDKYSQAIGLAFQVQDDILNVIGNTEKMGKPQGSDEQLEKSTYPSLMGLTAAKETAQQLYHQAISALDQLPMNSDALRSLAHFIVRRDN
ncbi:(2E,6E)-farnesyl diphosphate synthase [Zophobihabitans entericus]|uniref:(2E,6E)-farnesyl diphosphate synthase n=1 Tax=Zophobihabitans entericus TaxID=1635327 RepID=A0A6G9IDS4_9GAMM|nr:(2E,6E)-farnesyl diphosphate synthase [Zophobihabitans entericus]